MKTISLKLPDDVDARLEARAKAIGKSKSALTREALAKYLDGTGGSEVRAKGPGDLASNNKHLRGYGR